MKYKRQIFLLFLTLTFSLTLISSAYAVPTWLRKVKIEITPQKPDSYEGSNREFLADPVYIQGEQATFNVRFWRTYTFWRWKWKIPINVPSKYIKATFPDSSTRVNLMYQFWGRYRYTSPVLREVGNRNHTLTVALMYMYRFRIWRWWFKFPILVNVAQSSISVAERPLNVEITSPRDGDILNENPITVTGTVDDNGANVIVNGVPAEVSDNRFSASVPVEEGENEIRAVAENDIGTTDSDSIAVTIDTIPPQNPAINIEEGDYTDSRLINLILSAEEADEVIISENELFTGSSWEPYVERKEYTLSEGDGEKTVYVKYRDNAGNETDIVSDSIILDTTPPEIEITNPEDGFITNQEQIDITGTFIEENLQGITVNGIEPVIEGNIFRIDSFSLDAEGNNVIEAVITDQTGHTTSSEITVVKDTVPPDNPVINPVTSPTNQQDQIITGAKSNDTEIISVTCPTAEIGELSYPTDTTWQVNITNMTEGDNIISVTAYDEAGNPSSTVQETVILDIIPPEIEITVPENGYATNRDSIKVVGIVSEDVAVQVNGISALVGDNQFYVSELSITEGENIITAETIDSAGNPASAQVVVNLNNLPQPEILIDDFSDDNDSENYLNLLTGDNYSCVESIDIGGEHRISWNNDSSYWYTNLWDNDSMPEGIDISHYERLIFKVKGESGEENFSVELEDVPFGPDFNRRVEIDDYINITTEWQEVTIPIKDFTVQGIWKTYARSIVFNFDKTSSGTIYIDDIKLKPCIIDTFADAVPNTNSLGYFTGDNDTLIENIDIDGYHKLHWDNLNNYWWTGLWDGNYEFNADGFKYLYLRLKGENGGENFSIELQDNLSTDSVEITDYTATGQNWKYVYISLDDFSIDKSKLRKLTVKFDKVPNGIIYIDKIGITNKKEISAKAESTGRIKIVDKQIMVNDIPFQIKGVVYQPTPIGAEPGRNNALYQDSRIYNRDLLLIREMGCNVIRIFKKANSHDFLNACYNDGIDPIYVIMGFPIDYNDLHNSEMRNLIKQEFAEYVIEYKDDPAVLMWALGNEINMTYTGDMADWYSLANELAQIAYEIEGESYHPVTIVNRDIEHIGKEEFFSTDDQLNYIDLWGINAYRGFDYKGFFETYSQTSAKPLLITEYGADSWRSGITPEQGNEDPNTQAQYYLNNWLNIKNAVGCIGGVLMEYTDEWWKVVGGNYELQDFGGFEFRYDQPDNYSNEEFWGLFKVQDNGDNPDILVPKTAYEAIKLGFSDISYPETTLAWEFNMNGDSEGWAPIHNLSDFVVEGGILQTEITESDPMMDSPNGLNINALLYSGVEIRLRIETGTQGRLYWKRDGDIDFLDENSKEFFVFSDGEFHNYYIYLGDHPNWNGNISQLRLNPTSASSGQIEIDYIRIVQGTIPEDFTAPEDITDLTAESGNETVILNWTASLNTEGDLVEQLLYIDNGIGYGAPISLGTETTSYEIAELINGIIYTFKITCVDESLNESSGITVQATPQDTTPPEDITNLEAVSGDRTVTLNWTESLNIEGDLEDQILYVDDGSGFGEGINLGADAISYEVNDLTNDQLYRFKITCIDEVPNESRGVTVEAIPQTALAPRVEITSPEDRFITRNSTITVSGTINNNSAIVTVNGIVAVVDSGTFTANNVPLLNEEENQIIVTATYNSHTGYDQIIVYRDTVAPELEITAPSDGETVIGYP